MSHGVHLIVIAFYVYISAYLRYNHLNAIDIFIAECWWW